MEQDIRLTYSALMNQIRVSFTLEEALEEKRPSKDLLRRAKAKLEDEQAKGHIDAFALYEDGFFAFWDHLRSLEEADKTRTAVYVLAQGYRIPRDSNLRFDAALKQWLLTLPPQAEALQKLGWFRVSAWILHKLSLQPQEDPLLRSRILEAYFRALHGEKVRDFSLRASPIEASGTGNRVVHDKEAQRMLLYINDGQTLREAKDAKDLGTKVLTHLERLQEKSAQYVGFKKELQEVLKDIQGAPESFGFGLPLIIPIAFRPEPSKKAAEGSAEAKEAPKKPEAPAPAKSKRSPDQLISFEILDNGMEARINWANEAKLKSGQYDSSPVWIEKALAEAGIVYGYQTFVDDVLNRITLGQAIKGQIIAQGKPPQMGDHPYLYPSYLYSEVVTDEASYDIRSSQNRLVVEVGELVCEMRYRDGIQGCDIFGKPRDSIDWSWLERIQIGPGIERRPDGRFYSQIRGIPKLDKQFYVACREVYVHDGDVNLKSGDIFFDGDVEVRGSVDTGARVYAKGHLIVRGSISNARIRCGGNLQVLSGIITTQEGIVIAGGNVSAQFIENSRIVASQDVSAVKSILNSDVKAGGMIFVRTAGSGIIGGGNLVAGGGLRTQKLGFSDGTKTLIRIGSDWQSEFRLDIMRRRIDRLRKFQQVRSAEIDELKRKSGQGEKAAAAEKRMTKARKLGDRLERAHEALKTKMKWDDEALLIVQGEMFGNVDVTINGRSIPIPASSKEVMVSGIRYRDQFVNSLIYLDQYRKMKAARQAS